MKTRGSIVRFIVRHPWAALMVGTGALILGATLVVVSGIVPIKASSGHWPITARLLDFAKLRSVATYSFGIEAPPLDGEALIRGASHYDRGCYLCHGGPGAGVPPVMAVMTPSPPELTARVSRFKPAELFVIVKHGIKFTGMPAWPVQQRDDEIWAVVAFLQKLPGLDATEYLRLAHGEAGVTSKGSPDLLIADQPPPRAAREICWRCHGVDGTGRGAGAFPAIAGQRAEYLYGSLRAYANRQRFSGIMANIAAGLSDETLREVAHYYASLPPRTGARVGDESAIVRGAAIASRGVADRDIPACAECHGPTDIPKNPAYPQLNGQHVRYLALQLQLLRERRRGGTPNVNLMHVFVDRLNAAQIHDVTLYYASSAQSTARTNKN